MNISIFEKGFFNVLLTQCIIAVTVGCLLAHKPLCI